jgi:superfamily II DNA or RNA helicase
MSSDSNNTYRVNKVAADRVLTSVGARLTSVNQLVAVAESQVSYQIAPVPPGCPQLPADLKLRSYQQQAIDNWFQNQGRGTLKMATGYTSKSDCKY